MGFNGEGCGHVAVSQDLDELLGADVTCLTKLLYTYFLELTSFSKSGDKIEVDSFVFHTIDILEAEFGETALERHLTAFEADFAAVA